MGRHCIGLGEGKDGVSLEQWFSTRDFQPRGHLLMFKDIFSFLTRGRVCYRLLVSRGKDAACSQNLGLGTVTAAGHRTIPITKCGPAHNVNSVEVEKPCLLPLRRQRVKFSHGGCGLRCFSSNLSSTSYLSDPWEVTQLLWASC